MSRFILALILFGLLTGVGFGQEVTVELTNSIGMKLVLIPKGTFMMGSPESEKGHREYEVQHEVTLTRDYYLGMTEVTQAQYQKVMGENPSFFKGGKIKGDSSNHPVDNVSWDDVLAFCNGLSRLPEEKKAGRVYRLPTEAEWESACRSGVAAAWGYGRAERRLGQYAWFLKTSDDHLWPVGRLLPNEAGLFDMFGNGTEWCQERGLPYPNDSGAHPMLMDREEGVDANSYRVLRGGSFDVTSTSVRAAYRDGDRPGVDDRNVSFRPSRTYP